MSAPRRASAPLALIFGLLIGFGCGDDGGSASDAGPGGDADLACESFDTDHEELLNAPTNATVIQKTPSHPPVGDGGLP